jgi:hypothetical protein
VLRVLSQAPGFIRKATVAGLPLSLPVLKPSNQN